MVYMRDGAGGLLFLSGGGLHEVSCPADADNSIDITLMRCFRRTTGTDGETGGQLSGHQVFEYALMPLSDETDGELVRIKDTFTAGYQAFTIPHTKFSFEKGEFTEDQSAFTMHSAHCAYITSMPAKNGGILLRVANYSGQEDRCRITFQIPPQKACLCNFLEEEEGEALVDGNTVTFSVGAYRMATLIVNPQN